MKSDKKNFWDKVSKIYDLFIKKDKKAYTDAVERIRNVLNADAEVLELASGTGIIGIEVAVFVKSIIATDYSEKMIAPTFIEHKKSFKAKVSSFITGLVGFKPFHVWTLDSYAEFLQVNGFTIITREVIPCTFPLAYVVAKV